MKLLFIYSTTFLSAGLLCYIFYPELTRRVFGYVRSRALASGGDLDVMFVDVSRRRLERTLIAVLLLGCVAGAIIGGMVIGPRLQQLSNSLSWIIGAVLGLILGALVPRLVVRFMAIRRHNAFQRQLVDTLMLLSSSLRAGLSMLQAIEVLVEEMPSPISQEFGLVVKETKMGIALHEALQRLKRRMASDDLRLIVTAMLVARETGGDVTDVFTKLVETIRERQKFRERIKTLTVIPRMQASIMACLPAVFGVIAYRMSPTYFRPFLHDEVGQAAIITAGFLWIVSVWMMVLFSKAKV